MNDLMISTMPIKPYDKINIGLMIAPTLCDILGTILNCKKVLAFNLLHSYQNNDEKLQSYLERINEFDVKYDQIIKDKEYVDKFLEIIQFLYRLGFIEIRKEITLRCNCGKVEMSKKGISHNRTGDLFYSKNGKIRCICCGGECKEYEEKNMYLKIDSDYIKDISIYPIFLKKDFLNLAKKFKNSEILISKNRKTGYFFYINDMRYNIDIDMLWMLFNLMESSKNQILIASNHQLYEMFISNYINNILKRKNVHYIATPYITNEENIDLTKKIFASDNSTYKKLAILYNLKWKYKSSNWNNGILTILSKLDENDLHRLYIKILNTPFDITQSIENIIINLITEINFNKNVRVLKR